MLPCTNCCLTAAFVGIDNCCCLLLVDCWHFCHLLVCWDCQSWHHQHQWFILNFFTAVMMDCSFVASAWLLLPLYWLHVCWYQNWHWLQCCMLSHCCHIAVTTYWSLILCYLFNFLLYLISTITCCAVAISTAALAIAPANCCFLWFLIACHCLALAVIKCFFLNSPFHLFLV